MTATAMKEHGAWTVGVSTRPVELATEAGASEVVAKRVARDLAIELMGYVADEGDGAFVGGNEERVVVLQGDQPVL